MSNSPPPAVFILGPTASGKTALAMALADRYPFELVSVDSAQVFRDMNIGTAKPDAATLARYPHHLIDILSPEERYSAAQFRSDALRLMANISARGRIPLLVGGTMLYFKALLHGLADLPQADPALRAAIDAEAAQRGWPTLHAKLAALDPETAARLQPTDAQRIQRALEVVRLTGKPMGAAFRDQASEPLPYRVLAIGLNPSDRSALHACIAARFDLMLKQGLVDEVAALQGKYSLNPELPSMRSVGYRQVWEMLAGKLPAKELRERGIYATRQFAKRQITWFNSLPTVEQFDCLDPELATKTTSRIAALLAA